MSLFLKIGSFLNQLMLFLFAKKTFLNQLMLFLSHNSDPHGLVASGYSTNGVAGVVAGVAEAFITPAAKASMFFL